jgi:hypothetical protein
VFFFNLFLNCKVNQKQPKREISLNFLTLHEGAWKKAQKLNQSTSSGFPLGLPGPGRRVKEQQPMGRMKRNFPGWMKMRNHKMVDEKGKYKIFRKTDSLSSPPSARKKSDDDVDGASKHKAEILKSISRLPLPFVHAFISYFHDERRALLWEKRLIYNAW